MLVWIANWEEPDQTASLEAVSEEADRSGPAPVCLGLFGRQLVFKILEHLL